MIDGVRADHAITRRYQAKYGNGTIDSGPLAVDLVRKVGLQMLAAYRVMRFFDEAGIPVAPMIASRAIRHLYGSDIHWKAEFEPGIVIVHGFGLAISKSARVRSGAILFQHVTLAEAIDSESRVFGGPTIENDVHVGPGATVIGPIHVGARSKLIASAVVRSSVPADSLVEAPSSTVTRRGRSGANAAEPAKD